MSNLSDDARPDWMKYYTSTSQEQMSRMWYHGVSSVMSMLYVTEDFSLHYISDKNIVTYQKALLVRQCSVTAPESRDCQHRMHIMYPLYWKNVRRTKCRHHSSVLCLEEQEVTIPMPLPSQKYPMGGSVPFSESSSTQLPLFPDTLPSCVMQTQ